MNWQIQRILELAEINGKEGDPRLRRMLRSLALRPNPRLADFLIRRLTLQAKDQAYDPAPFRTPTQDELVVPGTDGIPYVSFGRLGRFNNHDLVVGEPFTRPLLQGHGLVCGSTGSGKSSAVADSLQSVPAETKFWVVDSEADRVYQNLALLFPAEEFYVLDVREFKRNMLEPPPNCSQDVWFGRFKANFAESCFVRDGGKMMISFAYDHCRRERPGQLIALRHLYQKIVEHRYKLIQGGREYSYYEGVKNRLEGLLVNPMFDCLKGFNLAHLATKNVLFLCKDLGPDDYGIFVNDLLCWLSCYFPPDLNPVPKLILVLEEVHRLANPQRLRRVDTEAIILDAVRTLAKRRVSLLVIDQVPSELPVQILANCSFRAIFNTIEGRDLDALQRSMSLSYEQRALISRLPKRMCVVQYANPNFPEPFPVVIDEFPLREDIDEEVSQRMASSLEEMTWVALADAPAVASAGSGKNEQAAPLVSRPALDYFVELSKDQFMPVSWRDRKLAIPAGSGNALRQELEDAGLIRVEVVDSYGRSKKIRNARVTEKGYETLEQMKVPFERPRGKGGWEHVYHQNSVARWARLNGYRALIEHSHDGKAADVSLEKDGRRIAAEIFCKGLLKELGNLRDLFSYDEIWFCVKDVDEIPRLKELISRTFGEEAKQIFERTKFKLLGDFQNFLASARRQARNL